MKSHHIYLFALLIVLAVGYKNNTAFWAQQLNETSLFFQAYSGYQEIDWYYPKGQSGMFYTFFGALGHNPMNESDIVPLIVWLQGGPGGSSQFGAFNQIGPIRVEKGKLKHFHSTWNIVGHTLFIDSPLNVGFSYSGTNRTGKEQVSSTGQATNHLINFLYNFYHEFPTLRSSPLYIAGESFGGHYVPNLASKILSNQTFIRATGARLTGISIGDGWVDPINQVNFYDSYLWSVGVVQRRFRDVCTWYQTQAILNIYDGKYQQATNFFDFLTNNDTTPEKYMGGISMFNFRSYDDWDVSYIDILVKNKAQFGVTVDYILSNSQVYTAFGPDISRSYAADLITCLRNIKVLIYNGQNDVVVNTAGVMQYINSLNWEGLNRWKWTRKEIWTRYGEVKGWAKVAGNLWFVLTNGAGHLVPIDQPEAAFSMIGHFVHNDHDWKQ